MSFFSLFPARAKFARRVVSSSFVARTTEVEDESSLHGASIFGTVRGRSNDE